MKKKWQYVLDNKQITLLIIIFFGILIMSLVEIISLASIAAYMSILVNGNIDNLNFIPSIINEKLKIFDKNNLILYSSIILFIIFIFKFFYQIFYSYLEANVKRKINYINSKKYFKSIIFSDYESHTNKNSAALIRKIQIDLAAVTGYFFDCITLAKEIIILFSIFLLLFFAEPEISSITLLILGLASFIFYFFIKDKITMKTKETQKNKTKIIELISQSVFMFKENLILDIRKKIDNSYSKELKNIENFAFFTSFVLKLPRIFFEFLGISGVLIITFLFIFLEKSLNDIIPILVLVTTSFLRILPSVNALISSLGTLRINKVIYNQITSDLQAQDKSRLKNIYKNLKNEKNLEFKKNLIVKNLFFKFQNSNRNILEDINFEIKKGQSIGIIGETGSGKTTLVDLLLGLLKPTKGEIVIDDEVLNDKNLSSWHKNIGYIPQNIYIINDTIKNNIAIGLEEHEIDKKKLSHSIKIANLEKFIYGLENGVDTKVGDRGIKISGGEKQRIAIARAIYKNPNIIFMDEATSSLDNKTEKEFMDAIESLKKNTTLIIIAHRLSTIENCDKVFLISKSKIIDSGTFLEIKKRNNLN